MYRAISSGADGHVQEGMNVNSFIKIHCHTFESYWFVIHEQWQEGEIEVLEVEGIDTDDFVVGIVAYTTENNDVSV